MVVRHRDVRIIPEGSGLECSWNDMFPSISWIFHVFSQGPIRLCSRCPGATCRPGGLRETGGWLRKTVLHGVADGSHGSKKWGIQQGFSCEILAAEWRLFPVCHELLALVVTNFGNQPWLWSACVFFLSGWFGLHSEWDIHYDWGIEKGNSVILFWLFLKKFFMWAVAEPMLVDDYMNYTTLSILLMIRIHELGMPITSFRWL